MREEHTELTWLKHWSAYLQHAPFSDNVNNEQAQIILQQLIEASMNGDTRIDITFDQKLTLADLVTTPAHLPQRLAPCVYDEQGLALYRYWQLEQRLARQICRLKQQTIYPVDAAAYQHLLVDPYQQKALRMVAEQSLSVITGGPGTGKTYTLARIIAMLTQSIPNIRIAMAAPTGKAAQRMQEALQASFTDPVLIEAGLIQDVLLQQKTQTLHRLLGLGIRQRPHFHLKQPLPYDVVVVDEASMLDLRLATYLFEAIPSSCRLILLGDAQQLASIDVGSVLADLQQVSSLQSNHVQLQTSRRFTGDAKIGQLARFIQNAEKYEHPMDEWEHFIENVIQQRGLQPIIITPTLSDTIQLEYIADEIASYESYYQKLMYGFEVYLQQLDAYIAQDDPENVAALVATFDDYRILTATREGPFGVEAINRYAEVWLTRSLKQTKRGDWFIGRPVMMTYNDYQLGLSNGDIGICVKHRIYPEQFEIFFPSLNLWLPAQRLPQNMKTAFAMTIHKSQGSEFSHTMVVLDRSAEKLLSQELFYTAITRAKKVVSLLVHVEAVKYALMIKTTRRSGLVFQINQLIC